MLDTLVRRERRTLWAVLSVVIVAAIVGCLLAASASRRTLTREAQAEAKLTAQTTLAPLLTEVDLQAPVVGERAHELGAEIERRIISEGPITAVRLYSESGRILYDADGSVVTVKPSFLKDLMYTVANGTTVAEVRGNVLETYVPVWVTPDRTVAVAEMSQPYGPIVKQSELPWYPFAAVLGLLLAGTITLLVKSLRAPRRSRATIEIKAQPGFRSIDQARRQAEQRAKAAEAALKELQGQHRTKLEEFKAVEARAKMSESESIRLDEEIRALHGQLQDTAQRLRQAELENDALRQRLALRQMELERFTAQGLRPLEPSPEIERLRHRLEIAERRATEMEAEVDRIEAELDYTSNRFHMVKLTEALREYENDEVGEDGAALAEHPKVFFNVRPSRANGEGGSR